MDGHIYIMSEKLTDNTQNQTQFKMYNVYNIE